MRLPVTLVTAVLGGLALVGLYEWFNPFVAGIAIAAAMFVWFETRLSHIADDVTHLEATVNAATDQARKAVQLAQQGRCGALPPVAYPGQPGTASCMLAHGHASEWHRGDPRPSGLPGMEWKELTP